MILLATNLIEKSIKNQNFIRHTYFTNHLLDKNELKEKNGHKCQRQEWKITFRKYIKTFKM